jgi:hypothetical protein
MNPPVEEVCGYKKEKIVVLLDDGEHPEPTRQKIVRSLSTLLDMEVILNVSTLDRGDKEVSQ